MWWADSLWPTSFRPASRLARRCFRPPRRACASAARPQPRQAFARQPALTNCRGSERLRSRHSDWIRNDFDDEFQWSKVFFDTNEFHRVLGLPKANARCAGLEIKQYGRVVTKERLYPHGRRIAGPVFLDARAAYPRFSGHFPRD
jgi:hypothetical protein